METASGGLIKRTVARIPDLLWGPVVTGGLMLLAGGLGFLLGQPWLFPSLGPTALMQAYRPAARSSSYYNTIVGHALGLAAGYLAVWLFGAHQSPMVQVSDHVTPPRMWASALAVGLTMLGQIFLRAYHPPAAATTLIIALGVFQFSFRDAAGLALGILLVGTCGELLRRARTGPRT